MGKQLPDEATVGMQVGDAGPGADNKFTLAVEVVNRLRMEVTVAPDPAPPLAQAVEALSPVMATRMAGPPQMMELEGAVEAVLASLTTWKVESDKLTLFAESGHMVFFRNTGSDESLPLKSVELP